MMRIKQSVKACFILNLCLSVIGGVVVITLYRPLIQIFVGSDQLEVVESARTYLQIVGTCYFAAGILFVYRSALQGVGNTIVPMIGGGIELVMRVFAALFLADLLGFKGLAMAYPLAWAGASIPLVLAYYAAQRRNFART